MEGCSTGFDWLREVSVKLTKYSLPLASGFRRLLAAIAK